jgi:hypothetical protein
MRVHRAFAILLLLLCLLLTSCSHGPTTSTWQPSVDALVQLTRGLETPPQLQQEDARKDGAEFDANQYFAALPHLAMETGYLLDYVYLFDGMGGLPVLYARPVDQPPYATYTAYTQATESETDRSSYLDYVAVDGTPEGFFEYTVLYIMGGQFYLYWHSNYNDALVIAGRDGFDSLLTTMESWNLELPDNLQSQARRIDFTPAVEVQENAVRVQVIVFSKWLGFARETYVIEKAFPHTITLENQEILVPYDCGIMF